MYLPQIWLSTESILLLSSGGSAGQMENFGCLYQIICLTGTLQISQKNFLKRSPKQMFQHGRLCSAENTHWLEHETHPVKTMKNDDFHWFLKGAQQWPDFKQKKSKRFCFLSSKSDFVSTKNCSPNWQIFSKKVHLVLRMRQINWYRCQIFNFGQR